MPPLRDSAAFCFTRPDPADVAAPAIALNLPDRAAQGLALLVPLLGCGEEAAALAFDGLADAQGASAGALAMIAAEERVHDALLKRVAAGLPADARAPALLRASKRFHINLGRGGAALHLGRIAAIDAAVCTIFSRLIRPGTPLGAAPVARGLIARIHRDEANHVRVARTLARRSMAARPLQAIGAAAREAMAPLLLLGGAAFEALAVDPDALARDVARLPKGLYA